MSGTHSTGSGLSVSEDDLQALIAARVAAVLSPERLEAMAQARVDERIGVLTLDEAARRFDKPSRRAMLEFCRKHRIPVQEFTREDRYVRVADIEAALQKRAVVMTSGAGTRVGAVGQRMKAEGGRMKILGSARERSLAA